MKIATITNAALEPVVTRLKTGRRAASRPTPPISVLLALAALFAVAGCAPPAERSADAEMTTPATPVAPPPTASPTIELEPCAPRGLEEGEARCGVLRVPEDRRRPDGRGIGLRVVVLPALGDTPEPDPVIAIPGGPGQGITAGAGVMNRLLLPVRERRDVVLFDPRGAGASDSLQCPLPGDDADPQSYFGDLMPVAAVEACRERLESGGADLEQYTAVQMVADLDDLRAALGYERINLYGISYGTRVAMAYLREHGERVRSAVLNGVVPFDLEVPTHHAPDAQRALDLVFETCAADADCDRAFPDLEKKFWTVHRRLAEDGPVETTFHDPVTERDVTVTIGLDQFNEEIRWRLYDEESNLIPGLVEETYRGDFRRLGALLLRLRRVIAAGAAISLGSYLSPLCTEDAPYIDRAEAARLAEGTFLGTYRVDQQLAACAAWPRGELPAGFRAPLQSDVPILLLSGFRDPVTPPKWGEAVLRHLRRGRHVVLQQGFHTERTPCAQTLVADFYRRGSADDLDDGCASRMPAAPFELDSTPIAPVDTD